MGLFRVSLYDADNNEQFTTDYNGTCTGVFQAGSYGGSQYPVGDKFKNVTNVVVQFGMGYESDQPSREYMEDFINGPFLQALCPGSSLVSYNSTGRRFEVEFPGYDTLPSDKIVTAMRFCKCMGSIMGSHRREVERYTRQAGYAFNTTANELICQLGAVSFRSDSIPALHPITLADMDLDGDFDDFSYSETYALAPQRCYAGMLLPLIRGELAMAWQPTLRDMGYAKENSVVNLLMRKPGRGYWPAERHQRFLGIVGQYEQDVLIPSVNAPITHLGEEHRTGPRISNATLGSTESRNTLIDFIYSNI